MGEMSSMTVVLLLTFIAHLIPFWPVPYIPAIVAYVAVYPEKFLLISLLSGIAAAVGKSLLFLLIRSGVILMKVKEIKIKKIIYPDLFLFTVALTPLPEELALFPLALTEYPIERFFALMFFGKVIMIGICAVYGKLLSSFLYELPKLQIAIISFLSTLILTLLLEKIPKIVKKQN